MQRLTLIHAVKARFHPSRWGSILATILLLLLWRVMEGESLVGENSANHFLILLSAVYAFTVTPVPWQWTADGCRMAPFWRGLFQSLLWNTLLLTVILIIPFLAVGPEAILGKHNDLGPTRLGWLSSGLSMGLILLTRSLCVAVPVGWFLAREEATQAARLESEAVQRTLEASARQAQMQALQSQLDPHVLYNALSGISELIHEDPQKADEAVVCLSRLYRKLTDLGRQDAIPLNLERELIRDYLTVEQIRLGSRLRIEWYWSKTLDSAFVPPLLIQPLVENAIKHGLAPMEEGGVLRILVHEKASAIQVQVSNNGVPLGPDRREGTGLSNLRARLELLGEGATLHLDSVDGWTIADLTLRKRGKD